MKIFDKKIFKRLLPWPKAKAVNYLDEEFYQVVFNYDSYSHFLDQETVFICANDGDCIRAPRGIPVVIPARFLEVADNIIPPAFPYTILRKATNMEYRTYLKGIKA